MIGGFGLSPFGLSPFGLADDSGSSERVESINNVRGVTYEPTEMHVTYVLPEMNVTYRPQ